MAQCLHNGSRREVDGAGRVLSCSDCRVASTETGWTKDVPTTNGWYWLKDDKTGPVLTEALNGCFYIHNSRYAPEPNDEWLGPISPSDAEQLVELRKLGVRTVRLIHALYDKDLIPPLMQYGVDGIKESLQRLLNPKQPGKETQG